MKYLAKVCGLTRPEDANDAASLGADLLGFVNYPPSQRHCADLTIAESHLDKAVLVMVAETVELILDTALSHGFRWVQPYLPQNGRAAGVETLRAYGLDVLLPWPDVAGQESLAADLYLWESDPAIAGIPGGSGMTHSMMYPPPGPFLLAGGLHAGVIRAKLARMPVVARRNLRGFDAASKLESAPGLKDNGKVSAFITTIRSLKQQ